jgi:hypothetical protein
LSGTYDCSEGSSREHAISRGVLRAIHEKAVNVSGFDWQRDDDERMVGIDSLTSRVLCTRHNNCLSPLDAVGVKFFCAMRSLLAASIAGMKPAVPAQFLSGHDLERWMLKVLFGSFTQRDPKMLPIKMWQTGELRKICAKLLLGERPICPPMGLYLRSPPESEGTQVSNSFGMVPLARFGLAGIEIAVCGIHFCLYINFSADAIPANATYRPRAIGTPDHPDAPILVLGWHKHAEAGPAAGFVRRAQAGRPSASPPRPAEARQIDR